MAVSFLVPVWMARKSRAMMSLARSVAVLRSRARCIDRWFLVFALRPPGACSWAGASRWLAVALPLGGCSVRRRLAALPTCSCEARMRLLMLELRHLSRSSLSCSSLTGGGLLGGLGVCAGTGAASEASSVIVCVGDVAQGVRFGIECWGAGWVTVAPGCPWCPCVATYALGGWHCRWSELACSWSLSHASILEWAAVGSTVGSPDESSMLVRGALITRATRRRAIKKAR